MATVASRTQRVTALAGSADDCRTVGHIPVCGFDTRGLGGSTLSQYQRHETAHPGCAWEGAWGGGEHCGRVRSLLPADTKGNEGAVAKS